MTRTGWRHRLRPTLRLRLTLLSGGLLLVTGAALLTVAWLLLGRGQPDGDQGLLFAIILAVVISGLGTLGAWLLTGRTLRPLHLVTSTAQRLGQENLAERIRYEGADDEVAELAATFDAMLDRLADSFEAQKRFVANASHELRTPLAVMRTEIDVTLSDTDASMAEYQRMGQVVRDASERANSLVEALLLLARTEGQSGRRLMRRVPADLAASATTAISAVRREADRMRVEIREQLAPAPVVGDPSLLDRLAGNLVENAARYNHLHGQIWVSTSVSAGYARLVVGNTGFEVDPADVPGLFEPFRRGGRERTGSRGSGLGLSIVRAVCDAHGGTVEAVPLPDGGLELTVSLPHRGSDPATAATTPPRAARSGHR